MPAQNIIDALGISWKLDTSSDYATLTYAHPVLGLLQYTGLAPWIADNVNTVHLTSRGDLPAPGDEGYIKVLPDEVCIRPLFDSNGCGCYDRMTYDTSSNQCLCKDPGCDCIPVCVATNCDDVEGTCTGMACVGGRDGVDSPSGPAREFCCVVNSKNLCFVWYCSAGQWKVDIWCDDVFVETQDIGNTGCPLTLATATFSACGCDGTAGQDCVLPPTCTSVCCPGGGEIPSTNLSMTFGTWWDDGAGYPLQVTCPVASIFDDPTPLTYIGHCQWETIINRVIETSGGTTTFYARFYMVFVDSSIPDNGCPGTPPLQPCCVNLSIDARCVYDGSAVPSFVTNAFATYNCDGSFALDFEFGNLNDRITVTL